MHHVRVGPRLHIDLQRVPRDVFITDFPLFLKFNIAPLELWQYFFPFQVISTLG